MEQLLTPKETAKVLGISVDLVRLLARSDELPYVQISERIIRFKPSSLVKFTEKRETSISQ